VRNLCSRGTFLWPPEGSGSFSWIGIFLQALSSLFSSDNLFIAIHINSGRDDLGYF
jgi:hypothetical protein